MIKIFKVSKELGIAMGKMTKANLLKVSFKIIKDSVKYTYHHKVNIIKKFGKFVCKSGVGIYNYAGMKIKRVKKYGIKKNVVDDVVGLKKQSVKIPRNILIAVKGFYDLTFAQKKEFLKDTMIYIIFFLPMMLLVGGGLDFEGGAPDLDMPIGKMFGKGTLGWHRNVFTHTIFLGLGVEVLIRITVGVVKEVYDYLPEEHDKIWDDINKIMPTVESASIAGAWMGIAIHLFKDSGLLSGGYEARIKAYNGLPFGMSDDMHQNLFAANGVLAGAISNSRDVG